MKKRAKADQEASAITSPRQRTHYIPLTLEDLQRGLNVQQIAMLREALNFERTLKELCKLGLQSLNETSETDTVDEPS